MEQRITPNLWFDTEAEEAAEFYVSIFDHSRVVALGAAAGGIIGWVWQKVANSSAQDPDSNVHWVAIPIVRAPGPTAPPAPPPDPR
jgi:predicted 3-demethylubiquinone-9 3-methyltransferase (glyoxalase superfamily)